MNDINFVNKLSFVAIYKICNIIVNNCSQVLVVLKLDESILLRLRKDKRNWSPFRSIHFSFIAIPIITDLDTINRFSFFLD